ncbi:MAG: 5-formyltetrahydrofolate cyclo-ligase [Firmicutes bacterium]|jgi:5-formyltetrahydrofolate cyclo-ligase|nr:5-formyltetrahydrofolate cyclo-ligase [Bacillota bacterium]
MKSKKELRKEVLARRDRLSWEEVRAKSEAIAERLFALPAYRSAGNIMYFLSFGKEVQTLQFVPRTLAHGKRVIAPKTVPATKELLLSEIRDPGADLAPGVWGIPEPKEEALRPVEPQAVDFVTVPGVAFDMTGRRLGYGAGYYDRFFPRLRRDVPLVALTFEVQLEEELPEDPWDWPVDIIITEKRVIYCQGKK